MTALDDRPSSAPSGHLSEVPARLAADRVSLGYGERTVVTELTVRIPDDQVTVIVGPNACGKSTLLRGMARLLRPTSGAVLLDGEAIHKQSTRQVARTLWACSRRTRSHPRASPSSTWSAADGTPTREPSGAGRARTSRRSPRRWS